MDTLLQSRAALGYPSVTITNTQRRSLRQEVIPTEETDRVRQNHPSRAPHQPGSLDTSLWGIIGQHTGNYWSALSELLVRTLGNIGRYGDLLVSPLGIIGLHTGNYW